MTADNLSSGPTRSSLIIAFAAVYGIWGSTYLAIRFAIETLPPFLMLATRFTIAGAVIYGWARLRGAPRPAAFHWRAAAVVGGLLLTIANGSVAWSEQSVPSGLAALLIAIVPLWMVVLDWLRPGGVRPGRGVFLGLALGLVGIALLVGPGQLAGNSQVDPIGALALMVASLSWAIGSLYSRSAQLPSSPLLATGMAMLAGGALLSVVGILAGEPVRLALDAVSLRSALSLGYLIVFGSIVAFTAYIWLLRVSTPARVSTYAYVNPVVAVLLGWALAGEPLTLRTLSAAAVIVTAVAIITSRRAGGRPRTRAEAHATAERDRDVLAVPAQTLAIQTVECGG